jgi:glycosyltransferase involved in cell wall biosynthesis
MNRLDLGGLVAQDHGHMRSPNIAYLSTYPPRECGLATYCEDLVEAIAASGGAGEPMVIAMESEEDSHDYPWPVVGTVKDREESEYEAAARFLNESPADIVNIQHEFGIYGGMECRGLSSFLEHLTKPLVTTLHTVLPSPPAPARAMIRELAERSDRLVVFNGLALGLLERDYRIPRRQVAVIHHGAPAPSSEPREAVKARLGLSGRRVLSTFGLVSPGKGLEYAISALPAIRRRHPEVLYLIAGETHPGVRRTQRESYRERLAALVGKLGLEGSVRFVNKYLTKAEIISYLAATDVYLTPYLNPHQVSSGTLAYAVAAGKAIVSTGYLYARFLCGEGRGVLVEFSNSSAIAEAVIRILDDPGLQRELESRTRGYGQRMLWPVVGVRYLGLLGEALQRQPAFAGRPAYAELGASYQALSSGGPLS